MSIWQNVSYGPRIHGLMRDAAEMEAHVEERRHAGPVRVPMEDKLEGMQTHRGHGASALTSNSSSTEPPADLI